MNGGDVESLHRPGSHTDVSRLSTPGTHGSASGFRVPSSLAVIVTTAAKRKVLAGP